jgi:ribosomal protein L22
MTGFGEVQIGSSDHRLLWIDITCSTLFGFQVPAPAPRPKNFFPIQDPLAITRYNNYLRKQRLKHHIPSKLVHLQAKAQQGWFQPGDIQQYDAICKQDDFIRKQAKLKSRRFYAGQVLYSDIIGLDYKELRMWHLVLKRRSGRRTDTRQIRRLMRTTNRMDALQLTLEDAKTEKQKCFRRYLRHKKDQVNLRIAFEQKQNQRIAAAKGISLSTQEKIRRQTRQSKSIFSNIRRVLGSGTKNALYSVEYTTATNDTTECLAPAEIEYACQREGLRRFTQAYNTPFLMGSLLEDLGYNASQHTTDAILTGSYQCREDVDYYTQLFLRELAIPPPIHNLPLITGISSIQQHIQGWKKMRPYTASSPYGPLFTDFIAGTHNCDVAMVDNMLAAIPLLAGFCPSSWTKAADVMIPKKTSSANVEKLRIIVLFHSLFNMINKRVGRRMIQRALDTDQIPLETFGSVPGRRANDCALNKALVNDILRQQRRPAALCSNDATSCYDRIVHVVASLCMQRLGVDATTCQVMFGTLQRLQHHIITAYGTSQSTYGGVQVPLHGVGQGNGAGPAIWLVMSIPMINMLRRRGFGFRSISPYSHHQCHIACFTFVDDTDTIHAPLSTLGTSSTQVIREMQEVINTWEGGLRATGGSLSPTKSYWYLIDFKWNPRRLQWEYKTIRETPGNLHLSSPDGERVALQRHEASTAVETLGIPLAMDGNQSMIVQSLQDKIGRWSSKIQTRQLTATETILSMQYGIAKVLEYPLNATRLNKRQCYHLVQPLRKAALKSLHIPVTFPVLLAHAPNAFLGLGFPDLWFEQGLAQVDCLLRHSHGTHDDSTAQLYQHALENLHLELGLPGSPFSHDFALHSPSTTTTQLHIAWQFCWEAGIQIKTSGLDDPPPREHDQHLMQYFASTGYSAKELRLLNLCRMFLQVKFVSDFVTGDGLHMDPILLLKRSPFLIIHI